MAKLPGPPPADVLARIPAGLIVLPAGTWLWRVYFREPPGRSGWDQFRTFGPVLTSRFDHQDESSPKEGRGIMYAALDAQTCLAEVFQKRRAINARRNSPWLTGIAVEREMRVLDLSGAWPTMAGASMAISSGPRHRSRQWSRAIYVAYPEVDGLLYGSSMNANQPALALYERSRDALPPTPIFHRPLTDPVLETTLSHAAKRFGYTFV